MSDTEKEIQKAELRLLVRNVGFLHLRAKEKSQQPKDPFNIYHFGQTLAYEEVIRLIKHQFHDEMGEDEWE